MKKVGIVTVYNACNYGSFLQAYALRSFLQDSGYKVDFLRIDVEYDNITSAKMGEDYAQYEMLKYERLLEDQSCFDITDQVDKTYQCCVIGSDTVWNMFDSTYENVPCFVGKGITCSNIISYAASVGQNRLSKILFVKGYKLLPIRKLKHIAVRDDKTEKIVRLLGREPLRVLDPTFLCSFHIEKPANAPQSPYMLVYTYGYNEKEIVAIKEAARKRNLLIIATGSLCSWADINIAVGSFEWLWLVKNAELIVTGTFHGSVFSIKYNKKFAVLTQGSDKVKSLLSEFMLIDRIATTETLEKVLNSKIDYMQVNKIIEEKTEKSKKYLLNAIEDR